MNNMVFDFIGMALGAIEEHSSLDDRLIDILAAKVKEEVPGKELEPVFGRLLVQIGTKLQDPVEIPDETA